MLRRVSAAPSDVESVDGAAGRRLAIVREVTALEYLVAQQFLLFGGHVFCQLLLLART